MSLRALFAIGIVISSVALSPDARAWGNDGHRIVGDIAWQYLTPKARAAVKKYLTDPQYSTLADAATWPDTYARRFKEYAYLNKLHYVDVSPQADAYDAARDCPDGCVVSALDIYSAVLSGKHPEPASFETRQLALYLVAHFVGDIHQPLHVAHPDNHGGGETFVLFFGQKKDAHWVWDTGIITKLEDPLLRPAPGAAVPTSETVWKNLAASLRKGLTPAKIKSWQATLSPVDWANESFAIAKQHAFLQSNDVVDASYVTQKTALIREQLQKAGVRLAAVLNQAFGK